MKCHTCIAGVAVATVTFGDDEVAVCATCARDIRGAGYDVQWDTEATDGCDEQTREGGQ